MKKVINLKKSLVFCLLACTMVGFIFSSCSNPSSTGTTKVTLNTGLNHLSRGVSDVALCKLTISADDMDTITKNIMGGDVSIFVKAGDNRHFELKALDNRNKTLYIDRKTLDLPEGTSISINFEMESVVIGTIRDNMGTFNKKPILKWEEVKNASYYELRFSENKDDLYEADNITCYTNYYEIEKELDVGKTYYWQCRYIAGNRESEWNIPTSITINTLTEDVTTYKIGYAYDLWYISENISKCSDYRFIVGANIDMNELPDDMIFTPIGNEETPFTGEFYGVRDSEIQNLTLSEENAGDYAGLFGCLEGATVLDIKLTNVNISGTKYVGGIAGKASYNYEKSLGTQINRCSVEGNIFSIGISTGGIVGEIEGDSNSNKNYLGSSYSNVAITLDEGVKKTLITTEVIVEKDAEEKYVGGIAGKAESCWLEYCYNMGSIFSPNADNYYAGAIAGCITSCACEFCINQGGTINNISEDLEDFGQEVN